MIKSSNECMCECHNNPNIKHCFPCCTICQSCGRGFIDIETHRKECNESTQITRGYIKEFTFKRNG